MYYFNHVFFYGKTTPAGMSRDHTLGFKLGGGETSFSQNGNLRFLTHDRDLGAKLGGK